MAATAQIIHLMRDCSGMSMMACKEAALFADQRLGGDYVTALLMANANSYAVNIRSRNPVVSDEIARQNWNLSMAKAERATKIAQSPWDQLAALSGPAFEGELA